MENVRKRMKIRITKTSKDFLKYASRPLVRIFLVKI